MVVEHMWIRAPEEIPVELNSNCLIPEYIRNNLPSWGWGETTAFESAETGRRYSHNQILKNSRAFAAGLIKLETEFDLKRSDVVAVMLPNVPEYPSIMFGIWEAGLIITPVNPNCVEKEIERQLEITRSKIIITSSPFLDVARSLQQKTQRIKQIILVEIDSDEVHDGILSYSEMLKTDTNGVNFFTGSQITKDNAVAILPFSSGTSGLPKAVVLTHFALLSNILMSIHIPDFCVKKPQGQGGIIQTRTIAILPFFHVYGFSVILSTNMIQGAHVLTIAAFNPSLFIRKLKEFQPQVLFLVPTLASFITNTDEITASEMEQVDSIVCGAAFAGEALIKQLLSKAKNATFFEAYGLTETGGLVTLCRSQLIGSIGQPIPGITIKLVDSETGHILGKEGRGEICIKTPSLMKGYLNNDEATKECIDNEGWLHTGDIGVCDESGCLYIVDRLKELIKVKGFQVPPSELENIIRSHEKVADVAVIGIPDDISGEVPRAFVVLKENEIP